MLGPEPAPTHSTSLPSSSPWDQGLPGGMPEQDSKSQPPAKDWKSPVNPTKKVSPRQSLLQLTEARGEEEGRSWETIISQLNSLPVDPGQRKSL